MNFIKTKKIITILMLVAHASVCCAAAQSAQRSLWQCTKDFVAEYPISTGVIGAAVAAGAYELAARSFGLSTLDTVAGAALEKIKTDRECQILAAGTLTAGAYSIIAEPFGLPAVTDIVKADLITGSQGQNENPAPVYHLLHGARVTFYGWYLGSLMKGIGLYSLKDKRGAEQTAARSSLLRSSIGAPLVEELIFTYIPRWKIGNNGARVVMPLIFGVLHNQYALSGMLYCAVTSFLRHHSLCMRPEYAYAPIISHVAQNAVAVYLHYARNR